MPPRFASPYHTHRRADEAFYVLDGELAFVCDGRWTVAHLTLARLRLRGPEMGRSTTAC